MGQEVRKREGERENLREGENVVVEENLLKEKARKRRRRGGADAA